MRVTLRVAPLVVGFYAWIVAASFGAILLDVAYASQVTREVTEVADLLLGFVAVAIVAGIAAVAGAWQAERGRNLLLVSLALLAAEPLLPALLSPLIDGAQGEPGAGLGPWIRLGVSGTASVLAFAGAWAFAGWRETP